MANAHIYDAVVIGSGLGGLTAAALLAKSGKRVCVLERNRSLGGSASSYRIGRLTIDASLHETADPHDPRDLKHAVLTHLELLDEIEWLPLENLHTVVGGPVGAPLILPRGFEAAAASLTERFPKNGAGIGRILARMSRIYDTLGSMQQAREGHSLGKLMAASPGLLPILGDWRLSVAEAFARDLGDCEGAKCALAPNLAYYHDDPRRTWWLLFAVAQGGYIGSGGVYVRGGSVALSRALAKVVKQGGGQVLLGRTAVRIDVASDGRMMTVHHAGKDEKTPERIEARSVLANCSPYSVADMLPPERRSDFLGAYDGLSPSISLFSVYFGVKEPPQRFGLTDYSTILLPPWMQRLDNYAQAGALLGEPPAGRMPPMTVVNYGVIDAGINEAGQTLVTVVGVDRVANWRDGEAERRSAWLEAILQELERHYPGFAGAVTEKTLVTARSVRDYLATPEGAVYGFAPTPPERSFLSGVPRSPRTAVPGLFLASSFAGAGGFTGAMGAGSAAAGAAEKALARA